MLQLRGGAGLALEPLDELGVEREGERQDLDRHLALQLAVLGPVDHGHPAAAELLDDLVLGGESLAHEVHLLQRAGRDRVDRSGRHEVEAAGGAELRFSGDFTAAAGAEHARKLRHAGGSQADNAWRIARCVAKGGQRVGGRTGQRKLLAEC